MLLLHCLLHYARTCSGGDLRAGLYVDLGDRAGVRRGHGVLHLHRLQDQHGVAGLDPCALLDHDLHDRARHRREQAAGGHRVGGVAEPRRAHQPRRGRARSRRRPRRRPSRRRTPSGRRRRRGPRARASRPRRRVLRPTNPSRVPHHSTTAPLAEVRAVRLAHHVAPAGRNALLDRAVGPRRGGQRQRRSDRTRRVEEVAQRPSRNLSRNDVLTSPARNVSDRSTSTSRSRFVTTPWIRARREHVGEQTDRSLAGRRVRDHLGQHRVVVRRDRRAGRVARVDADARRASGSRSG